MKCSEFFVEYAKYNEKQNRISSSGQAPYVYICGSHNWFQLTKDWIHGPIYPKAECLPTILDNVRFHAILTRSHEFGTFKKGF